MSFPPNQEISRPTSRFWITQIPIIVVLVILILQNLQHQYIGASELARVAPRYPVDSYYYLAYAQSIQAGEGPQSDWPPGPRNRHFPGFSFWWAMFLEPGQPIEQGIADFVGAQFTINVLMVLALAFLGWLVWQDYLLALGFTALASSNVLLIKWSCVPLSEPLAALCVTLFSAFSLLAWKYSPRGSTPWKNYYVLGIAGMAISGAAGFFTRAEVLFPAGAIVLLMTGLRRAKWSTGLFVLAITALPVAIWQVWSVATFGEINSYMADGIREFAWSNYIRMFIFQAECFMRVPNVRSSIATIDIMALLLSIVFCFTVVTGLRGYLGRLPLICAWICLLYWVLHAFWYYTSEQYNLIILPFGYIVFVEGVGRLYNWRNGWKTRGAMIFLLAFCLIFVRYSRLHGDMNVHALAKELHRSLP